MRLVRGMAALAVSVVLANCAQPGSQGSATARKPASETAIATQEPDGGSPKRLRLLSSEQYLNTLAYVFGDDVKIQPNFAPLPRTDGLLEKIGRAHI